MQNLRNIKPLLMFVSVLSFAVSLVFTVKLLSSQGVTGADKALFGGLAISAEFGKVILFSLGMVLLFVFSGRKYSWIGLPLLLVSFAFTVFSVFGTMGALAVGNAEKTEQSAIYTQNNNSIQQIDNLIAEKNKAISNLPENYVTKKNQITKEIEVLISQKNQIQATNQKALTDGISGSSHDALYSAIASWFGCSVLEAKNFIMSGYGILLEALSLFCALFAFFGDYLLGNKIPIAAYEEPEHIKINPQNNYTATALEAEILRKQLEAAKKKDNWESEVDLRTDYEIESENERLYHDIESAKEFFGVQNRTIGFMGDLQPSKYSTIDSERLSPQLLYDYWKVAYDMKANGKESIAAALQKSPTTLQPYREKLQSLGLIGTNQHKTIAFGSPEKAKITIKKGVN